MADWVPIPLPFSTVRSQLPTPLPSEREILESTTVFSGDASHNRVVAIGSHFVVKHGQAVSEIEGQTLLFLEKYRNSYLTVPKLYAMYYLKSTGHLCLVMERLPGETLEFLWPRLEEEDKSAICTRLNNAVALLRELPAPGFYGGVGNTSVPYHLFWDPKREKEICGPFDSEVQFNAALVRKLRAIDEMNGDCITSKVGFYQRNLDTMLSKHGPVFTHSDLQCKNVLVHRQLDNNFKVSIIDWETAGWYPSYWEYSLKFATMQWVDDWPKRLEQVIDPWPCEAAVLRMLYQDLWF